MRIERITVTHFGPLRDLDIPLQLPPSGGVVVVQGPNEAGKSTLLRFMRTLLFGGESAHGALVVEHGGTRYRIEQRGARGTLALTDLANGQRLEPTQLQRMVGNLDAKVYRQVFAFGLEELQAIHTLTGEDVQERIFSAAVAGAGRSVREVQRGLAAEIQGLWRPRAASSTIRTAARDLREALAAVREAERAAAQWPQLQADEEDLAARITAAQRQSDALRADLRRNELLLDLHDRWSARRAAQAQRAAAPAGEPIPPATVDRIRTLRPEIDVLRGRDGDLTKQVADLEPAVSAAVPHEDLLPLADRIEGVRAGVPVQRQRVEEDLPKSAAAVQAADALLAATLAPLGADWTEERLAAFPLSSVPSADIETFAETFDGLKRERIEAEAGHKASLTAREQARTNVEAGHAAGADLAWLESEAEIRALAADAGAHRSRIDRLERLKAELQQTEANLTLVLSRLGPAWNEATVLDFAAHAQWRRAAEDAAAQTERGADERRKAQVTAEKAQADGQGCRDRLDLLAKPAATAVQAEEAVRALHAQITTLEELSGTLQEWHQTQQETVARPQGWLPLAASVALPLLLAAWLVRPLPVGAAALAILAGVLAAVNWPKRAQSSRSEATARLARRLKELGDAAGLATVDLGSVNGALSRARSRQGDLVRESEACRTWEAAHEALRQAELRLGAARAQLQAAERAEEETRRQWRRWCEGNGVPAHLRPGDLPGFLTDLDRAHELAQGARAARAEATALTQAVEDWRRRVQSLAQRLPEGQAPFPEQAVDALHHELERAAELRRAALALEDAEGKHATATAHLADLDRTLAALRERWATWCRDQGLPPLAAPEDAKTWMRDARAAADQAARVRALRLDAAALQARSRDWEAQALELLQASALLQPAPDEGLPLLVAVEALAADLHKAQDAAREREQARTLQQRLRADLQATRAERETKEAEISSLLAHCGAESEADLTERLQWQIKRQEWERTVREAEDELARRAGQDAHAVARLLDEDAPLRWQAEADRLREQLPALEAELNDPETGLRTRVGALRTRREALEVSGDIARHRLETEQRKKALAEALRRWVVCRLAEGLIGDTLKEYERSHVPEVIRSASERFARVTGGRYQAVHAVEAGRLRVATGQDAVLDAADLSRGTQEQLYLVVRLGLVDSFSRQSESLPLVLDDVLVNSDPERQQALIRVLADAARDHQTIMLTCHPQASAAIQRQAPDAQVVRLERIAGTTPSPAAAAMAEVAAAADGAGDPELGPLALAALGQHSEGLGSTDLAQALGISAADLRTVMAPLVEAGAVVREGRTRGMKYRLGPDRAQ